MKYQASRDANVNIGNSHKTNKNPNVLKEFVFPTCSFGCNPKKIVLKVANYTPRAKTLTKCGGKF